MKPTKPLGSTDQPYSLFARRNPIYVFPINYLNMKTNNRTASFSIWEATLRAVRPQTAKGQAQTLSPRVGGRERSFPRAPLKHDIAHIYQQLSCEENFKKLRFLISVQK